MPPVPETGAVGERSQPSAEPPAGSDAHGLASEAEEIRRLIDAGADSPEALRDLAARLREHRAREESMWRADVKPALVKENKGRLRGHRTASRSPADGSSPSRAPVYALMVVGLLILVAIAAATTGWLLVIPVVGLLAFAWKQGRDAMHGDGGDPPG